MNIYYDKDANPALLHDKQIAVIGYGSQGFAQANNLKDSGCNVTVGLRAGSPSWEKAAKAGFNVQPVAQAAAEAEIVMMLGMIIFWGLVIVGIVWLLRERIGRSHQQAAANPFAILPHRLFLVRHSLAPPATLVPEASGRAGVHRHAV